MDMEGLYAQYFRDVYRFALSLSRDAILAEEITQETFFRAVRAVKKFDGRCHPRTWLCSIAKNLYFSRLRVPGTEPLNLDIWFGEASLDNPDAALETSERLMRMHRCLHALPEPYREVFSLRIFGELSHAQVAAVFSKSEAWARTTYYRAKLLLQQRVREEEDQ